jgi:hypothetical protein
VPTRYDPSASQALAYHGFEIDVETLLAAWEVG